MNTQPLSLPSRGIDVVSSEGSLPAGYVRSADNIVLQATGEFSRRPGDDGSVRIALSGAHSLWRGGGSVYAAAENQLYRMSSDMTTATSIFTGLPIGKPVEYAEVNGSTYFTAPGVLGKITSTGLVRRPGVADLNGYKPTLTATVGGLVQGVYGVAYSLTNDLGEESGLSNMETITLPDGGGVLLTNLVQANAAPKINIYITAAGGGDLALNQTVAFAGTIAVRDQTRLRAATKLNRQPMPGGVTVRHHHGRLYTAVGNFLMISDAFDMGVNSVKDGWIAFGGRITCVQPVVGGIFVGLKKKVLFLAGTGPENFELREVSDHGAVANSAMAAPADFFNSRMLPNQSGNVAIWLSDVGLVVGQQDGSVIHAQSGRIRMSSGPNARPATLQQMGIKQTIFTVESIDIGKGGAVDQTLPGRFLEEINSYGRGVDIINGFLNGDISMSSPTGSAGGDFTGSYPNPTLVSALSTPGTFGDGTHVARITFDAKGRAIAVQLVAIAFPAGGGGGPVDAADVTGLATVATSGDAHDLLNLAAVALTGSASDVAGLSSAISSGVSAGLSGLAAVAASGSAADLSSGTLPAARLPARTGDVTASAGSAAQTIAAHAVTNAKLAQMAASSFKGNTTGATADVIDMTAAQAKALLAISTGDVSGLTSAITSGVSTGLATLAAVAASGSASDLTSGTLPAARLPSIFINPTSLADKAAVGVILQLTYDASLTPGAGVYLKSDSGVDKANATDATKQCIGVATETASSGTHGVLVLGFYRDDTAFTFSTVGGLVYLDTTAGLFTQTAPTATDTATQIVGRAEAAHVLYVNPQLNYLTHT